jgi:hypothetical protein
MYVNVGHVIQQPTSDPGRCLNSSTSCDVASAVHRTLRAGRAAAAPTRAAFNNPFAKPAAEKKGKTVARTVRGTKPGTRDSKKKVEKEVRSKLALVANLHANAGV